MIEWGAPVRVRDAFFVEVNLARVIGRNGCAMVA